MINVKIRNYGTGQAGEKSFSVVPTPGFVCCYEMTDGIGNQYEIILDWKVDGDQAEKKQADQRPDRGG